MNIHTKGPWTAAAWNSRRDGLYQVCSTSTGESIPIEASVANARLIAAAPEMMEALNEITDFYMNDCKCTLSNGFVCIVHRTKKIIAKAEKGEG